MKKTLLSAAAITAAVLAPLAHAADGTVDFVGKLVAQTCTVTINGSPFMSIVRLPAVSTGKLATAGETTGQTGFKIDLTNCSGTAKSAAAFFEATSLTPIDPVTGNMTNGSMVGVRATNVQLQLVDALSGKAIRVGDTAQHISNTQVPIDASGNATLPYAVQYYATGATTAGSVGGDVYFSVNYQ